MLGLDVQLPGRDHRDEPGQTLVAGTVEHLERHTANADTDELVEVVREYVKVPSSVESRDVKLRRYIPEQIEYEADKLPVGSSEWWRQMDRERRGGRR